MSSDPNKEFTSNGKNFVPHRNDTYPFIDPKNLDLSGRHVLITGASKGIGRATALSYAAAGVSALAVGARSDLSSLADEIHKRASDCSRTQPKVVQLSLDVTSKESVAAAAEKVKKELGHLDIVINNAGVLEKFKPYLDSDPDIWWNTFQTNVFGPYLIVRSFLPLVLSSPNPDKTLVGVASSGAHAMLPGASAYQTTKLSLLRMMEFVGAEYGEKGVLAYSVHPGGVGTELAREGMPQEYHFMLSDTPELSGDSMVFLTGERREWLQGRYISCQWDMEAFLKKKEDIVKGDLLKVRMAINL